MPVTSSRPRPPASAFVPPAQRSSASFDDDDSTSDDSGDEAAALEMDGQELWAQNYCATCDCLIEPGQGVGAKRPDTATASADAIAAEEQQRTATAPSTARASNNAAAATASGLKSRNGTIKARPPSAEAGAAKERIGGGGAAAAAAALKRTHSAGRLHAVGGGGALGQHKRTGSAAGRLNALSDLKPTTKLNADDDRPNAKAKSSNSTDGKRSPALSRRNSTVSTKSGGSGAASGSASPAGSTSALPRTKKGGLLAGLTPAALRQEEEAAKAPPALYCSERCRLIDEQRSAGLGELAQYLSQPMQSPAPSAAWASPNWGPTMTPGGSSAWPRRVPSMTSMPSSVMAFNGMVRTPESECMCHECMDRSSSASGTVQSGASDTTESSVSYAYGAPGRQKQRTTSGRIVTPHNLQAHTHIDSYFPTLPGGALSTRRLSARDSPKLRPVVTNNSSATRPPLVGSGTDSSEGSRSPWDLTARQPSPPSPHGDRVTPRSPRNARSGRARSSTGASEELHGTVTTGTVTPAATIVGARRSSSPSAINSAGLTPVPREADLRRSSTTTRPNSMHTSSSYSANASPLRLLRRGDHHAEASVESSTDFAHSPHTTSLLSSSMVSNSGATEMASSATTLGARANGSSIADRRAAHGRAMPEGLTLSASGSNSSSVVNMRRAEQNAEQSSDRLSSSLGAPSAMARLKEAAAKTSVAAPSLGEVREGRIEHHRGGSETAQRSSWARDERRGSLASTNGSVGSTSTGWLRSLTSAWATIRGAPSTSTNSDEDEASRAGSSGAGRRHSVAFSDAQPPQYARSASSRRGSSGSGTRGGLLSPAIGSLTALSTLDARSRGADPTPTQSLVTKPEFRRGSVPAFATDIGRSGIPGEQLPIMSVSPGRDGGRSKLSRSLASTERRKSSDTRDASADEERRRRKAEHRHQRSRDVTVLPPLLGPNSRTQSSNNMYGSTRPHSTRTQSTTSSSGHGHGRSRSRAGSQGQSAYMQIGSAGSYAAAQNAGLSRPTTPSLRKSPRSASGSTSGEASYSYSNPPSAGTSPRRAGLGWGAMTAITPAPDFVHPQQHGHSASLSLGHAAMAARGLNAPAGYQHAAHVHQPHHHGHHHTHGHVARPVHGHRPAATMQLGHVGMLGAHPHGHGPVYGRHATTPVRSSTPRVPEDGGEMSSAALTGEAEGPNRPRSAMGQQRGSGSNMAPPRPRSVIAMRAVSGGMQPLSSPTTMAPPPGSPGMAPPLTAAAVLSAQSQQQHNRTWSYEALPGLKTYPVLQLPGRETHDQYDAGWGLGEGGLEEMLTGRRTPAPTAPTAGSASANGDANSNAADHIPRMPKRKTLFYFDQS